jgi:hypothetical protein
MRSAPVLIALVMLQMITMAGVGWSINERARYMAEERKLFSDERKLFLEICVQQQRTGQTNYRLQSDETVPLPPLRPLPPAPLPP